MRRKAPFYLTIAGMLLTFAGSTFAGATTLNKKITTIERLAADHFKTLCVDYLGNPQKTITHVEEKGYSRDTNRFIKNTTDSHHWVVHTDDEANDHVSLSLHQNACTISATMAHRGKFTTYEDQTPTEHLLMNVLGSVLVNRKQNDSFQERVFDSFYQGRAATIILQNLVYPSHTTPDGFFYQVILKIIPR